MAGELHLIFCFKLKADIKRGVQGLHPLESLPRAERGKLATLKPEYAVSDRFRTTVLLNTGSFHGNVEVFLFPLLVLESRQAH